MLVICYKHNVQFVFALTVFFVFPQKKSSLKLDYGNSVNTYLKELCNTKQKLLKRDEPVFKPDMLLDPLTWLIYKLFETLF